MYVQPLNNGIFTACEYSLETNPFGHASYEIYLSIKDLEILVEIRLFNILLVSSNRAEYLSSRY